MTTPPLTKLLTVAGIVTLFGGCHKDPASSTKPDVINQRDNFHLQMSDVKNHDTVLVYYWQMQGSTANIDQSAEIRGGQITVTLEDSSYQQVYLTDMKQNGSFTTFSGAPGWWRIRFVLKDFSGLIDFRAQRR